MISSLASFAHVSAINTTEGSFAWIISPSSLLVRRFLSPQQFHTRRFIVTDGAELQPLPIQRVCPSHSLKPIVGGQLIPYVQIALERAGPNIQSEDKRVSKDDQ